jgi:glucose-6-phosphate dehydrogenase assembly protein OpcA
MSIDLTDTSASKIAAALVQARHRSGSPAMGMVLTLIVVAEEKDSHDALRAALEAAREHPSRVVVVIPRGGRGPVRLDAEIRVGGESGPGETVVLRLHGPLAQHAESVVLPLLLPDAPVVVWWPGEPPAVPAEDPMGALARRRVTDSAAAARPLACLAQRGSGYHAGDTDLSWTRLTPWRALVAAALDQPPGEVRSGEVSAERSSPSAELLATWLEMKLGIEVTRKTSRGPGITAVRLRLDEGELAVTRPDGRLAVLSQPGQPDRPVSLHRREISELLAEELRRLDEDEVYGETVQRGRPAATSSS